VKSSLASVLWRCEPTIAAVNIEEVAFTTGNMLAEDLTPHSAARKLLRITTVSGAEVLYVSCFITDRVTRVEFFEPATATPALVPLATALIAAIISRGEREGLPKRPVGFQIAQT
jgi:hypothetical protein